MSNNDRNQSETVLREAFRKMNANQAQTIREAYYKAVEGLSALAEALEIGDLEVGESNDHALLGEHLLACQAIETIEKSFLGRVL